MHAKGPPKHENDNEVLFPDDPSCPWKYQSDRGTIIMKDFDLAASIAVNSVFSDVTEGMCATHCSNLWLTTSDKASKYRAGALRLSICLELGLAHR